MELILNFRLRSETFSKAKPSPATHRGSEKHLILTISATNKSKTSDLACMQPCLEIDKGRSSQL